MGATNALIGLSSGLRSGMERNREQRREDEDRQMRLADAATQRERQKTADERAAEEYDYRKKQRDKETSLRDAQTKQQEDERARLQRERQGRALYGLARVADEGHDPSIYLNQAGADLPAGTSYDATTGEIVIPGADGSEPRRYKAKEVRQGLEETYGTKEKPNVQKLSPGERLVDVDKKTTIVENPATNATNGLTDTGRKTPDGARILRLGNTGNFVREDTFEKVGGSAGGGGATREITPAEIRLRSGAFRSALDTRTRDQFGRGSTLTGEQKQQYGAIADRMIAKYGAAAPGADDLAQIIMGKMSALPSLSELTDQEVQNMKASGTTKKTGWFDGISDSDATRKAAQETAKAKLKVAHQLAETEIEQEVADIATSFYGFGAAGGGEGRPAARGGGSAPVGVDGKPLW